MLDVAVADSILLLLLSYRCFFPSHTRNVLHQPHLADSISTGVLCVLAPLSRCCSIVYRLVYSCTVETYIHSKGNNSSVQS